MRTQQTKTLIHVPEAPPIPGLIFRHYMGASDLEAIVALNNQVYEADQTGEVETVEQLAHHFKHLKNCDPFEDILLAEIEGQLAVYSRVWWVKEDDGTFVYCLIGNVHPVWRGVGLGTALLPYNEGRLREIARQNNHLADAPAYFESWCGETTPDSCALLDKNDYKPVRYFFDMSRPVDAILPEASLPVGLEVRPFDESQNRTIWEAIDEAFRDHWGAVPGTEEDYQRFVNSPTRKTHLWQVAWDGDQVAGMILNNYFPEEDKAFDRQRGWTDPICVRRPWRRRGLARALIARSVMMFRDMGFDDTALGVDTENPNGALKLYKSMGYKIDKTWMAYRKPVNMESVQL
ncbi:MAG: GNAT family N-acetyltransferase [Anaerolineales bacterium]|nr:GNAT family N-acetyltransferase [Anaerolineales bacterium]